MISKTTVEAGSEPPSARPRLFSSSAIWLVTTTLLVASLFYGEILYRERVYYPGDMARIYLPAHTALTDALASGRFPWWTNGMGAGYPLLAEGEVAALYPPSWLAAMSSSVVRPLSVLIVAHYLLGGWGFYLFARRLGASRCGAYFGALVTSLGGYGVAHLSHASVVSTAAWLPWLLYLTQTLMIERADSSRRLLLALGLSLAAGLHLLAGHVQTALLGLILVGCYGLYLIWPPQRPERVWSRFVLWIAALSAGALIAAPQLLVSAELGLLSERAGGLSGDYFTSYSFHPYLLATFVSPFALGNPYPEGSVEVMGYMGLMPLCLALIALLRSPARSKWFFLALALAGLLLALGRWNPLYAYLAKIPVLNLFRAPSRYLYWTTIGVTVLAVLGFDSLRALAPGSSRQPVLRSLGAIVPPIVTAIIVLVAFRGDVDALVAAWRWLPLVMGVATVAILWAVRCTEWHVWTIAACAMLIVDLWAYGAVLDGTFNATLPLDQVRAEPTSLAFFQTDDDLYRIYTKEEILYAPLVPSAYGAYLSDLSAPSLNLLNVKYYLIPQLLPVDERSELCDVQNPMTALPVDTWLDIPPLTATSVEIESYLSHSTALANGTLVAELLLLDDSGEVTSLPLRAGIDTSEWAYEREDVLEQVVHDMATVASSFQARSGFPPTEHRGHTYAAHYDLAESTTIVAVQVVLHQPEAFVRIEQVGLYDEAGQRTYLDHLLGLGNHSLVYRSEDVLVYRNEDVWPRAYTVAADQASRDRDRVTLSQDLTVDALGPVDIVAYGDTEVRLETAMPTPGYLILADLAYPGWTALVDEESVESLTCNGIFRAVALDPGTHLITFTYAPLKGIIPRLVALVTDG